MALVRRYNIPLDELEQKALKLLHAKTGAEIARDVFGVDDEIYRAIQWLSSYPVSIEAQTVDMSSVLSSLMGAHAPPFSWKQIFPGISLHK